MNTNFISKGEGRIVNGSLFLFLFLVLTLLPFAEAKLGTFQQGQCIELKTILNATSVNISTVSLPNGSLSVSNKAMTNVAGSTWSYTFCSTSQLGNYNYDYFDNTGAVYANNFDVTLDGQDSDTGTTSVIMFTLFAIILLVIAYTFQNYIFAFFSGCAFLVTGVYSMIYGFSTFNTLYPRMISVIIIGLGLLLIVASAVGFFNESSENASLKQLNEEEWDI